MKTIDITPEEMQRYIARYDDLTPNKARTAGNIPPVGIALVVVHGNRYGQWCAVIHIVVVHQK